jgi:predicted DNA-binding ribbon-helix-helix protein
MIRTQISLTEEQHTRLQRTARQRGVSMATLIREAVEIVVPHDDDVRRERRRRAFALAGAFRSGRHDTAATHDDVLGDEKRW